MFIAPGATSQSIDVRYVDDDAEPLLGLLAVDAGPVIFSRAGPNAAVSVTLVDLALITTPWTSGGFKERGNGVYRVDLPNSIPATNGIVTPRYEASDKHLIAGIIDVGIVGGGAMAQSGHSAGSILYKYFTTRSSAGPGAPTGLALSWSKDGADVTPSGGVTLTHVSNGRHLMVVNTVIDPTTFVNGSQYAVYASAGTIDGVPVFEEVVWEFALAEAAGVTDDDVDAIVAAVQNAFSGIRVSVVSPLSVTGRQLELYVGDAYDDDNDNPIMMTFTGVPDVTGMTCTLGIGEPDAEAVFTVVGEVVSGGGAEQTVKFEITRDQTQMLSPDERYSFDFEVDFGTTPAKPRTVVSGVCLAKRKWAS